MIATWYKAISPILTAANHGAFVKDIFLATCFPCPDAIRLVRRRGRRDLVLQLGLITIEATQCDV